MKSYDNHGKLVSEINTAVTKDGSVITTLTSYNTVNGQPLYQNVAIRDTQGKVSRKSIVNGKLLP